MHQALRRALATLAAVALTAGLAACSDDGKAAPKPMFETSSQTPSATNAPTATTQQESIEDFLTKWSRVGAEAESTGDTAAFNRLAQDDCENCQRFMRNVEEVHAAGGSIRSKPWRVTSINERQRQGPVHVVTFTMEGQPFTVVPAAGSEPTHYPGGQTTMRAELARAGSSWMLVEFAPKP